MGLFLGVAAVCAAVDWYAVGVGNKVLEYVTKPATLGLLIAAALALDPVDEKQRCFFVAALVLSLIGDVFLMLPRDMFVAGLASFLLGHLAYVAGMVSVGTDETALIGVALVAIALVVVGRRIVAGAASKRLGPPVIAYMAAISAMVICAYGLSAVAAVGATLFFVSDSLIGWSRFVRMQPWMPVAIIVTYHLGQAALTLSLT